VTHILPLGIERWRAAWIFAGEAHKTQTMPGSGANYLVHLGDVTMEIISAHLDSPLAQLDLAVQCAILHDTIEDQGVTHAELSKRFGGPVADGVLALSKSNKLPPSERMKDSIARIQQQPMAIWCVKLADRISNLHGAPVNWTAEKTALYRADAIAILNALGSSNRILAARLEKLVASYPDGERV